MPVARVREGPYYKGFSYRECMSILPGPKEFRNRQVSVGGGSIAIQFFLCCQGSEHRLTQNSLSHVVASVALRN